MNYKISFLGELLKSIIDNKCIKHMEEAKEGEEAKAH